MSDERIEKLEKSVQKVRTLVREQRDEQHARLAGLRWAVFAAAVAGSMLAFTSATWRITEYERDVVEVSSLWGLVPMGFQAGLALALVLAVAVSSVGVFLSDLAGPTSHVVLAVLASLAVVAIVFVNGMWQNTAQSEAIDESGAGLWLTLFAALVLAIMHASRAAELRKS
jgi:hypothetical protein